MVLRRHTRNSPEFEGAMKQLFKYDHPNGIREIGAEESTAADIEWSMNVSSFIQAAVAAIAALHPQPTLRSSRDLHSCESAEAIKQRFWQGF